MYEWASGLLVNVCCESRDVRPCIYNELKGNSFIRIEAKSKLICLEYRHSGSDVMRTHGIRETPVCSSNRVPENSNSVRANVHCNLVEDADERNLSLALVKMH